MIRADEKPIPFEDIADAVGYDGTDAIRSVRRLFTIHRVPYLRPTKGVYLATPDQYRELMEAVTCSPSASEEASSMSAVRSASARKPAQSGSTLQDAVNDRLQRTTYPRSKRKSGTSSFTVVQGGKGT